MYKSKEHTHLNHYRPIVVLPSISKIFEYAFLELLSSQQYGLRAQHSSEIAALNLVGHMKSRLDSGNIPINIYINLSKTFDTLTHNILLQNMSFSDVYGLACDLLKSYLTHKQQLVDYNGCISDTLLFKAWTFFVFIYINDLPTCTTLFNPILPGGGGGGL